ncbi:MAG: transcriptional regulator [Draconibacterium sp.]|nr:MAG: transcriptional regulator [Draconibacterium sp.]PIF06500.1 MAG: transcriptional regulator [Draconibacterium sp.]
MKDRINELMNYKNISATDLSGLLDVQRSSISHILNGRNKPGAALIEKILLAFPDLNARWLLTGKGDMVIASENSVIQPVSEIVDEDTITASIEIKNDEKKPSITIKKEIEKVLLLYSDGSFETFSS